MSTSLQNLTPRDDTTSSQHFFLEAGTPRFQNQSSRTLSRNSLQGFDHNHHLQIDHEPEIVNKYHLPVDPKQFDRATEVQPCNWLRPHMRIFHLSWMSGITGFIGWYAIPPLMPVIKEQLHLTSGQVLNSDIAATASTIITRIVVGPLLDIYGPQEVQSWLLWIGAIPVACAAFVTSSIGLLIVRFFIGFIGCVFVSGQYWTTITFAKNVVGTSNAITGGAGLAGIGFAFLLLPYVNMLITSGDHVSVDMAWRITIALPAIAMVIMGSVIRFSVDSCPMGDFQHLVHAKREAGAVQNGGVSVSGASLQAQPQVGLLKSFQIVLSDWNTLILILHYGVCFGAELQLNNMGALYFYEEFLKTGCTSQEDDACHILTKTQAATVASAFGLMNLVARAVGGLTSDYMNRRFGMKGRLYVQFVLLCLEGALVIVLSRCHSLGACAALYVLIAISAQSAGGSTFGIVPYLNEAFTGTVTGLVGAGGNLGGVVFGVIFRATATRQDGLLYMGMIIMHPSHSRVASLGAKQDGRRQEYSQQACFVVQQPHCHHHRWVVDMITRDKEGELDDPQNESTTAEAALHCSDEEDDTPRKPEPGTTMDAVEKSDDQAQAQTQFSSDSNNVSHTINSSIASPSKVRGDAGVQVTPLPSLPAMRLVEEFQVGKILGLPFSDALTTPITTVTKEEEASYIPVTLARAHLAKVVADMHTMKDEQALKIAHIMERYKAIEQDTQAHYENFVKEIKSKAKHKIEDEKRKYAALESASAEKEAQAAIDKQSFLEQHEQEKKLHEQQRERWREHLESSLQQHEDAMAYCHVLVQKELARVSKVHDLERDKQLRKLRNELVMCWEDAKSESCRMFAQLEQLRKELLVKEKAFLRRVQKMQNDFEIELEILQCLNTVVNHVVDMVQQQSQRHKTRELTTQISKLESEMEQAAQRESSLQIRLEQARERFASIERAAVVDTMELILQTLEIAPATPSKPVVVVIDTITTSIQTDQQEQVEQDPGIAMILSQLQYESQVERIRERNLDILHSKQHLKAQKAELQTLLEKKNAAKTQIKAWLADFQAENGREPTIEDKAQVKDLYLLFKVSEEAYNSKKESVALLKASHHEKVLEIDTIAQWQAMGDTIRKSARTEEDGDGLCASGTSSVSSSRPVSSSLSFRTRGGTTTIEEEEQGDTSSPRKVPALKHELWLLRAELEAVKRARDKENEAIAETTRNEVSEPSSTAEEGEIVSTSHGQDRESMQPEQEVQFEEAESGDYIDVPNEEDAEDKKEFEAEVGQSSLSLESETTKARLEALVQQEEKPKHSIFQANELEQPQLQALKQQQELVAVEMEQQRASLQTTITQLTLEIDQRKEEKAKLEKEIEQLRLHLELMELNHDDHHHDDHADRHSLDNDESIDHQSDEKQPSPMRAKWKVGQNTFFDDEEAVESESDDDNGEVDTGHQNVSGTRTLGDDEELLDANEGDEDENNEQDDMYQENADAKDAAAALEEVEEEDEKDTETPSEKDDFMTILHLVSIVRDAVEQGKAQFNRGDKAKCYQTYLKASEKCVEELRAMHQSRREDVAGFKAALSEAARLPAARGSMILRKQLDLLLADCEKRLKDREERAAAKRRIQLERSMAKQAAVAAEKASSPSRRASSKSPSPVKKSHKKATPQDLFDSNDNKPSSPTKALSSTTPAAVSVNTTPMASGKVLEEYKQKLKALEAKAKSDKVKITQLEASLVKAESQFSSSGGNGNSSSNGGGPNSAVLERKMVEMEKKHKHALEDAEKNLKKEITSLSQQLQVAQTKSQSLQDQVMQSQKELSLLGGKATQLSKLEDEMVTLKQQAAQASAFSEELTIVKSQLGKLETSYKEEQSLRKKYYNMIEDMKGKIRVYARCRPMSSSELERGCSSCVKFVDEYSMELETSRGPKPFAFDQVFSPASSQDQVFEDTKNLLQSAIDGYNVCIFAYGQTGSGKTFTMTGTDSMPGLSPRAISHLFALAEDAKSNNVITFQAFMLELYNDNLIDLFHLVDLGHDRDSAAAATHKLEIKKNDKGMVFVANSTMKVCTSSQQTLKLFEAANKKRQVGSTKMNAESSRSHSVFSILVENYNKTTKATSIGKLSLVDLAGSERAGKTGATAERLKEAQAINKSLSALGDVISALSTNEKFIPYRNNKLTQLMQDSLGGNAKTLMFVNISPADYNQEETQTSLQYASRVKLITNNANKNSESELVNRLKHIIKQLKAGKTDVELDGIIE